VALRFAEAGANIALVYASNDEAAQSVCEAGKLKGVRAEAYRCNVADFEKTKETVKRIIQDFGGVDILVNNAGITRDGLIYSMSEEAYDAVMDTNLKGAFHMIKHCCPQFIKKKAGKIINISSVAGIMGNAGQANYAASKAGLIGLTKSVARELSGRGVCCNAIAPGFIETEMTEGFSSKEEVLRMIPLGRMGKAEEVAELALFLASDKADYITGEVIRLDGGMAI